MVLLKYLRAFAVATAGIFTLTVGLPTACFAQSLKQDLVGTWMLVESINTLPDGTKMDTFGPNPSGVYIFSDNGRVAIIQLRSDLPKFASNNRVAGTADENKAVVQGSIAYFGTYAVNETEKVATITIDGATFPNWKATTVKRPIAISGDELTVYIPGGSAGGTASSRWKRTK